MPSSEIESRLKSIIADKLVVDEDKITPEARFAEDLGADSLGLVELIMAIEEEFNIDIPDEDAEKILSFGDALKYVDGK
jgi:acyl carrier protein